MKNLMTLLFCLISITALSQQLSLKKNTVLHYQVIEDDGSKHTFDITIDKFGVTGIKFNWAMKFNDNNTKGVVTVYKAALETAVVYRNYFGNNTNIKLTKESTVWMSKKNYNELVDKKESELSLDFNIQKYKWNKDLKYEATIFGAIKKLNAFEVKSTTTDNAITILKDAANPLILKMKPKDFTISLISIEQK